MSKPSDEMFHGVWIYILVVLSLISSGLFLNFRYHHPVINLESLLHPQSNFAATQLDPCNVHIEGGIPYSPSPDGNIQLNFICSNNRSSFNYLRLGAIPAKNIYGALVLISQINNFDINSIKNWTIRLNGVTINPTSNTMLKVGDELTIKNETN